MPAAIEEVRQLITKVVSDEPDGSGQASIRRGVCDEIDRLKDKYNNLDDEMQIEVVRTLLPSLE